MESISVPYVILYWNGLVSDIPERKFGHYLSLKT